MLYHIEGVVSELNPTFAVIDCGGVGYGLSVTPNTASNLKIGEKAKLYVSESIGEDHFDLYGFMSSREKLFYKMLTSVSGIGPKAGMSILTYNTPEMLALAIINSDEKALTSCPGIGKKTAQRVILELKDKIAKEAGNIDISTSVSQSVSVHTGAAYDEAISALTVLGYNLSDLTPVLKRVNTDGMSADQIIKQVLKFMV